MGYSNVQGDLNVFSSTSTGSLIARGDTILYGNLSALAGSHTFGNLTAANLTVTGNFTVTATNTQVSNALSINNAGTATALKVVQFEGGGPGHAHNVAEFWDYTTLAMVIDPEGNVGIHTTSSPGYSLTVAGGGYIDAVTASLYTGNGSGLSNLQSSSLVGPLAASQLQAAQGNITSLGTITTANVGTLNVRQIANLQSLTLGTNVYAPTANVGTLNVATISNLNSLVLVNNLYASNALSTTNVFVDTGLDVGPGTLGTNVVVFSNTSGGSNIFVMDSNGRIGIGTTTPGTYLQSIYSNVTTSHMLLSTDSSALGPLIRLQNRDTGGTIRYSMLKGDQGSLQFITATATQRTAVYLSDSVQNYYVNDVERMRMNSVGMSIAKGANPTATLDVAGNIFASNALQTTNLLATTANVGTLNVATISNLNSLVLLNNLYTSNALQTTNLLATTANVGTMNVATVSNLQSLTLGTNVYVPTANVGTLNVATISNLNSLVLVNNLYASNALQTTNLLATTTNVGTLNVATISNLNSLVLLNNLYAPNAVTTTNLFSNTLTASSIAVTGNIYASNAVVTTNVVCAGFTSNASNTVFNFSTLTIPFVQCTTLNAASTANVLTLSVTGSVGQTSLSVSGNISVSNAVTTTNLFAITANVGTLNVSTISNLNSLVLLNNLYASNALQTTNVFSTTANVGTLNVATISNLNSLVLTNNLYASNALQTTNLFATTANVGTLNVATISNLNTLVLTNNLYAPNALSTTNVFAVTATVPGFTSQFTVNGGGTVTFSAAGYLLWSGRVLVIPAWRNAAYATAGYWDIYCPTSGTIIFNGGTVTCTAAGIPLSGWFALYYRVVPGTGGASVQANFLIKDYTDTTYSPDSNWILLAVRNGDSGELKWMPGNTTIPLGGTFYTPSASYDKVQVAGTVVVDSARTGIFTNLYSANSLSTTNIYASTGIDVGPGTLGTNVAIFSNSSGGSNVFVMNSNGRIGIGTTNPGDQLDIYSTASASPGATVTNSGGSLTINAGVNAIYFSTGGTVRGFFNSVGFIPNADLTYNLGVSAGNRWNYLFAGTAALTGGGANVYAANAVTTTNLLATTANVGTLNVSTISNLNSLVLTNLYASNALSTTNVLATTANVGTLNVSTISNLNSLVLVNNLYASNALTATNVLATTSNVGTLNVWQVSNLANLTISNTLTTTNIVAAGFSSNTNNTIFNFDTLTIPFVNSTTLNVASTANLDVVTLTSLTVTGNISASNALTTTNILSTTANVGTLNVATISNLNSLVLVNNLYSSNALSAPKVFVTTANIGTLNVWQVSNLQSLTLGTNVYAPTANVGTLNVATVSNLQSLTLGTNVYAPTANVGTLNVATVSNLQNLVLGNALTTTNVFATRANVGTLNVTTVSTTSLIPAASGIFMNLAATYSLTGTTNWTGNIAGTITSNLYTLFGGGLAADWTALGSNPFITGPTANGGFKFGAVGPYSFTVVLCTDNNIKTLAVSSNTSDVHSNLANPGVWLYCYRFAIGHDPSTPVTLPFYVNDTNNYYYIDFETVTLTDQIHRTAYTNVSTDTYTGSYVLVRPI